MVTGDNLQTAKAIALECGVLQFETEAIEPAIIEGQVFRAYSEKAREEIAEKIIVRSISISSYDYIVINYWILVTFSY